MALLVREDYDDLAVFRFVAGDSWTSVILLRMALPILESAEKSFPVLIQQPKHLLGGMGGKLLVRLRGF